MSDIEQIDFSTLIWVKKELDETFNRAQAAIEEYVENPEDENQLQFCATYLHQVQGTLKMVELYGAAMVAEEMEQVVKKILNKEVDSEKDSFEVLMRGIILLPDYLERIQLGYKDIPMVLLPLVNDLRTVKGDQLLSESALFNPDLSLGLPESNLRSSFTLSQNQLEQVVKKIRSAYQVCLLNWLKNVDVKGNLKKIQIIVDKLKTVITPVEEKQLFWVAGGLFEALINGGLEESVTVKQLAARLDQAIRMITVPKSKDDSYYRELTNNLLYYVALSDSKDRRINEIQQFFNLANFISDDKEIEHAQSSLSGKNRELLESVTSVIKEDLMTIQESLDLYNRNHETTSSDLENIIDSMRKISDTLGIIGIGVAREKVRDEIAIIEEGLKTEDKLDNDVIMHVAETLLFVESSLDENIQSLGEIKPRNTEGEENSISTTEMKNIMDTLAKESISNLQKIKHNFVQYIEEPWKKETIESSPKLLKEISGALNMSGYKDVAEQIDKIEVYTSNYMLNPDYKPTANQLNMLAESIASLEYYLEYLSDGVKGEERILELAKTNIDSLFETIELAKKHNVQPENIDADLDNMSDDDFDLEDELDDEFDLDSNDEIDYEDDLLLDTEELIQSELSESTTEESSNPSVEEMNNSDETTLESQENAELEEVDKTETELELSFMEEEKKQDLYVSFGEETDEDIKEVFLEEFEEELEHLNSIFPRWEKNPDEQMELLGEIRRIYHTLKGSGRLVGALAIGDYSWRIEDMTNLVLNDSERLNQSFILVMQKSTEILPDLYQALKDETIVPPGYYQILEAAEKVIDKQEVTSIIFDEGTSIKDEIQTTEIDTGSVENDIVNEEFDEIITLNEEIDSTSSDTTTPDDVVESDLSVDPVFIEILQQEVEGHLSEISEYINNIKETGNASSTEQFIRVVHTLNGAANMASVKSIVEMTTPLELAAKLSNELDVEFENETVEKISEFSAEASEIMKDLTSKSQSNQVTSELHDYFKNLLEELESKKHDLATKEETGSNEFDLSEFLDDVEDIQDDENIEDSEDIELDVAEASLNLISEEIEENDSIDSEDQEDNSDVSLQDEDLIDIDLEQSEEDKSIINEINEKDLKQVDQGAVTEQVSSENDGLDLDFSFDEEDLQADRSENEEKDLSSDEPEEIEISEDLVDESLDLDSEIDLEFDEDAFNNNTKETNIDVESESTDAEESTLDEVQEFEELSLDDLADGTNEDFEIELEEITLVEGVDESEEDLELELADDLESESEEDLELELEEDLESESEEDLELELEDDLESESEEDLELELEDDLESESEEGLELELELEDDLESESEEDLELELELEENLESESEEDLEFELEEDLELESEEDLELETEEDLELETEEELESESEEDLELEEDLETEIREDQKEDVTADASEDLEHISATISTSYDDKDESDHDMSHEFDEELLEIFKEEADDILDRTEHVLSDLEENPKDSSLILALQRDLHTLKGGARMAGLENIGNLGHVLESLLEIIGEENRNVDKPTLEAIQESFDLLNKMKELKDYGESFDVTDTLDRLKHLVGDDDVIPEESKLDLDYLAPIDPQLDSLEDEIEIVDEVQTSTRKANVLSGNQIKVRSELLDNLVNYAGEVSIYRSRLEQEVGSFRVNLSELGNTVARIKEQLRKLDAETEAQIISTFQTVDDDEGFDPLEMDRFSQLQQLSRSLTESVSDLTSIHSYLDDVARTSDNLLTQQSRVNTELQEGLMETRLVSFNSIVPRLRRLVRTTSKELDKPVKLDVNGAEGEMDKTVLEGVIAPLEHMLRNSLAHGIESDRNKANKPAKGSINIDVRREATEVVISIADDGAGINRDKVKKLAEEKGLIKKDAIISDENIDRLILNSGFSTVDEVSKLAGRGVGMDVVGNQINLLGGTLDIRSKPNQGTIFSIRLPYTLALSSALLVEVSETIYAIPVSGLEGIIRMSYPDYQQRIKDKNYIYEYANEEYDIQELNTLLDVESEVIVENNQIPLVMIRSGDNGVALRVDNILGSREIVVKTVGSQISSVPGIYGATILGDGNVVLILDVIPLSRAYAEKLANIDDSVPVIEIEEIEKDPVIMIVDDSITMRKVGERILRRNEYDVETAKDGLDALEQLSEVIPDVMLLDIEMPRMDGYELAIEMKKEEKYADIPIIMITSRTGEKHRQKAMDLGVDRYLGKPYQEADLLENIRELIESKKY